MALDTFQTYKYHELLNKEYSLYKVSKDGTTLGITNSPFVNGAIEIIPFKYEDFLFFRTDRILAKYKGIYGFVLPVSLFFSHYDEEKETAKDTEFFDYEYNPSIDDSLDAFDGDVNAYNQWRL